LIDRNRYGGTPRVTFSLIDKCKPGVTEYLLYQWKNYGHKAKFQMSASAMASNFHNRCLWMRASLPANAGENVELNTADYFYTNDRIYHESD
jgi:hypothetical protein